MPRFIASARNPRWPAQEPELRQLFGVTGGKWPKEGCPARCIQGIWVHVLPINHVSLRDLHGAKTKRAQHRCLAACPDCGVIVSAGRLAQHKCNAKRRRMDASATPVPSAAECKAYDIDNTYSIDGDGRWDKEGREICPLPAPERTDE